MKGLTTGTLHGKLGHPGRQHRAHHLRRPRGAGREPDRRGGRGLPRRHERHRPGALHGGGRRRRAWPRPAWTRACKYAHERETFGEEIGAPPAGQADDREHGEGDRDRAAPRLAGRLAEEPRRAQHARDVGSRSGTRPSTACRRRSTRSRSTARTATRTSSRWSATCATRKAAVIYEGTSQLHTLIQADYALGYREDRPIRCEPLPAQGFERWPALGRHD